MLSKRKIKHQEVIAQESSVRKVMKSEPTVVDHSLGSENSRLSQKVKYDVVNPATKSEFLGRSANIQKQNTVAKSAQNIILNCKKRKKKKKVKASVGTTVTCVQRDTSELSKKSSTAPTNAGTSSDDVKDRTVVEKSGPQKLQEPSKINKDSQKTHFKRYHKKKTKLKPHSNSSVSVETTRQMLSPSKFSSNWKVLQQILDKEKKPYRGKKRFQQKSKDGNKSTAKESAEKTESKAKIWFDDVDDILIETMRKNEDYKLSKQPIGDEKTTDSKSDSRLVKAGSYEGLTKIVAVDCEMVGVGEGGKESVLARVSIVNQFGQCVYDKYVRPQEHVTDYRTRVSGIRREDLQNAEEFSTVQADVSSILKDRILVGHAIENDLKVLFLDHPRKRIRDTSSYKPFRKLFNGRTPALRKLAEKLLMVKVQEGEHNSVQDAQAAMRLYTMYKKQWEKDIKLRRKTKPRRQEKNSDKAGL